VPLSPSSQGIFHWILLTIFSVLLHVITLKHQAATMFVPVSLPQIPYTFLYQSLTVLEVLSQLQALDIQKSVGPDDISAHLTKEVAAEIAFPLTFIFNKSARWLCSPYMEML